MNSYESFETWVDFSGLQHFWLWVGVGPYKPIENIIKTYDLKESISNKKYFLKPREIKHIKVLEDKVLTIVQGKRLA